MNLKQRLILSGVLSTFLTLIVGFMVYSLIGESFFWLAYLLILLFFFLLIMIFTSELFRNWSKENARIRNEKNAIFREKQDKLNQIRNAARAEEIGRQEGIRTHKEMERTKTHLSDDAFGSSPLSDIMLGSRRKPKKKK